MEKLLAAGEQKKRNVGGGGKAPERSWTMKNVPNIQSEMRHFALFVSSLTCSEILSSHLIVSCQYLALRYTDFIFACYFLKK